MVMNSKTQQKGSVQEITINILVSDIVQKSLISTNKWSFEFTEWFVDKCMDFQKARSSIGIIKFSKLFHL